jgi:hypothetical protein
VVNAGLTVGTIPVVFVGAGVCVFSRRLVRRVGDDDRRCHGKSRTQDDDDKGNRELERTTVCYVDVPNRRHVLVSCTYLHLVSTDRLDSRRLLLCKLGKTRNDECALSDIPCV